MTTFTANPEKDNFFLFPNPFVWWTKLDCHEEIKEKYIPLINKDIDINQKYYNQKNDWNCKITTSFFNEDKFLLHIFDEEFLNKVIWNSVDKMLAELTHKIYLPVPDSSIINHVWYNKYDDLNWQEIHNHENIGSPNQFSGIYLLSLEEQNTTCFVYQQHLKCYTSETLYTLNTSHLDEGHVIIFPCELMHYVNPSITKNRLTVSFNIDCNYNGTK